MNKPHVGDVKREDSEAPTFAQELTALINKHSLENTSNTPDYVLAAYLVNCLVDFNHAVNARERHKNG